MKNPSPQILSMLQWSHDQYCTFQFEQGLLYVERISRKDKMVGEFFKYSPVFWNWWRMQWQQRDSRWRCEVYSIHGANPSIATMRTDYRNMHNPVHIVFYPSKAIYEDAYAKMVGKAMDQLHNVKTVEP